jgi:hypothetical protein
MKKLLAATLMAGAFGCSHATVVPMRFVVTIDSHAREWGAKNCVIIPAGEGINRTSFTFQEFSAYVREALIAKCGEFTEDTGKADVAVFFSYGIGEPVVHTESALIPMMNYQPGRTTTYSGSTQYGGFAGPTAKTSGAFRERGQWQTTYQQQTITRTTYTRFAMLQARPVKDLKTKEDEGALWETSIESTGGSSDLRYVMPAMIFLAKDAIGANTGRKITREILADSPDIAAFIAASQPQNEQDRGTAGKTQNP